MPCLPEVGAAAVPAWWGAVSTPSAAPSPAQHLEGRYRALTTQDELIARIRGAKDVQVT